MNFLEFVFWAAFAALLYTYIGYPLILITIHAFVKHPVRKNDLIKPVTLIVAAYNEEKKIEAKILNSLELNYPADKLEILVVSDGSTDKTDELVRKYGGKGVQLLRVEGRRGKTYAQNCAVEKAKGEILFFSDATTVYENNVIINIIRNFADPSVGCVSGKLLFTKRPDAVFGGEKNTSEKYDQAVKKMESDIHSIFGVNGCLYAVKAEYYKPLADHLTSDFVLPLQILKQSLRVVFEPEAICYEEPCKDAAGEFKRKVRTSRAGITGMYFMKEMLNPFRYCWPSFGLISHKVVRWMSPFLLILLFVLNVFLARSDGRYAPLLFSQLLFYAFAALGFLNERQSIKYKVLTIPFNFLMINLSAILGFIEFLKGNFSEAWETNRD